MKYTIEGFSQERAVQLGLSAEDLVILRWFVDFWPSDYMVKMEYGGKKYGLVSYKGFIEQMPIITSSKKTLARKFSRLVESGVLENVTIRRGGSYSVYRFGKNYESLVSTPDGEGVTQNCLEGLDKNVQPVTQNCPGGLDKNGETNTSLLNTNLINTSESTEFFSFRSMYTSCGFPAELVAELDTWMEYKKKIRKPYKTEIGMKRFVDQVKEYFQKYGAAPVISMFEKSITNEYQGVFFDELDRMNLPLSTEETPKTNSPAAPRFEAIFAYAEENGIRADSLEDFFAYWKGRGWMDGEEPVDWKQKLREWE